MSFRDSLVVLRPYPASTPDPAIDRAVETANAVSSRVSAIACGVAPKVPRSILGDALLDVSGIVGEEKRKSAEDVQRLLSRFTEQVRSKSDLALGERIAEMRAAPEVPDVLADYARLYDLTIVPMCEGNHIAQFDAQWHMETIVFGSGHPTIIVPQEGNRGKTIALAKIIVAWDGSRTAARAIADALPLLRAGAQVRLLTVVGEKEIRLPQSGTELSRHLALQGINAVIDRMDAHGASIGEALAQEVKIHGADLLVMGAYGHSRIREFILGGATRAMLSRPPTALFLSH